MVSTLSLVARELYTRVRFAVASTHTLSTHIRTHAPLPTCHTPAHTLCNTLCTVQTHTHTQCPVTHTLHQARIHHTLFAHAPLFSPSNILGRDRLSKAQNKIKLKTNTFHPPNSSTRLSLNNTPFWQLLSLSLSFPSLFPLSFVLPLPFSMDPNILGHH